MAPATDQTNAILAEALEALRERKHDGDQPDPDSRDFQQYFHGIAEAHHVIRKVFRLVDEQAKHAGLEPLEHKLLIQVFGGPAERTALRVNEAAARLDIAPALASRLIKRLEDKGLVARFAGDDDRRTTRVAATTAGRELLATIDRDVRRHVDYFQDRINDAERAAALRIFAFYLGVPGPTR